ncbi:MAG: site-specific DNA-methyltransferase, partial [Chloroflexi bacterium]|nr:site-specific DNA-methyltransferase [Chloroflexota bacterium]
MADPNFKNRTLYHGDNLEFLRGMNSETVHLIATDPPFNKNRDFHATPDSLASGARFKDRWSWDKDVHEEWTDSIQDDWPAVWEVIGTARAAYGDDMGAFLCWLGVRLMEMRRILRQDGSIYLHIDHTAHAYVKCLMDAIFGRKQFRNEIVWSYQGTGQPKNAFKRKHDTILFYAKSAKSFFSEEGSREPISDFSKSKYTRQDEKGRYKDIRHPDGSIHRQYIREYQRMRDVWDIPIINAMAK